jgi:hypothetical protein
MRPKAASWAGTPRATSKPPAKLGDAEQGGEGFAHLDALGTRSGISEIAVAAGSMAGLFDDGDLVKGGGGRPLRQIRLCRESWPTTSGRRRRGIASR